MAVKMQEQYGDDLNIVLVEVQGATAEKVEKFALDHEWFGTSAMWTVERPFNTGARGIPNCVLLSPDGEVVLKGHPVSLHAEIEDHIATAKRTRTKLPAGMPKDLSSAWKAFAKGKLDDAAKEARK